MRFFLGLDVGAVSVKAALIVPPEGAVALRDAAAAYEGGRWVESSTGGGLRLLVARPRRARGRPLEAVRELLASFVPLVPESAEVVISVTGSGGGLAAELLGVRTCNEFQACARAIDALHPAMRTVFEIGGETSRYLRLEPDPASGTLGILDYSTNGDCAAGTGAFLDQQAGRLQFAVEDIGDIVATAGRAAQIAGRCSVFAKSDMIHAQQKGYAPAEVLRGLCNAVAANFKTAVVRGRTPVAPVAFLGGVSANTAVVRGLRETFELGEDELVVPPAAESLPAVGAALAARDAAPAVAVPLAKHIARLDAETAAGLADFARMKPLTLENVVLLRDQVRPYAFDEARTPVDAYLGLDIGSVGTKLVLVDEQGEVIHSIFTRTQGRPVEVVARALSEMEEAVGWAVRIRGVGSTGSGRELIGELVGADSINDEITAHKTGAAFVGDRLLGRRPDTIFEIGGQDSKYISLEQEAAPARAPAADRAARSGTRPAGAGRAAERRSDSIVVDFTMNEACAAGTGSFLEERAEELGVSIKREFSALALRSTAPLRLGERCTVFMERDVNVCMQRGARREDVIAGLAYSVAFNYINRVVRGRPIGQTVFFQGGTAYNDAVAAAFSHITGKTIIVPPHNAVLGAIGAALLAREKIAATGGTTRFRGYDLEQVEYTLREFACNGCSNHCAIQEFTVEGEKTFWGDKCSDRFRKRAKSQRRAVIPDLIALRRGLLHEDERPDPKRPRGRVGIPMSMYTWDWLPMWRRFFRACGFAVVLSDETNRGIVRAGLDCVVAEPCFPIIVAHGHVSNLVSRNVDCIYLPNLLTSRSKEDDVNSYVCPWGSTLPFVVRQAPAFRDWRGRILCPRLSLQEGADAVRDALVDMVTPLGVPRRTARRAVAEGWACQERFSHAYQAAGRDALAKLIETGEPGMVLVGRPYNIHDAGVSLSVARKLRDQYGVNVLPVDALPLEDIDTRDICDNMYWAYGRRNLAAGRLVARHENLHIIYVTNFKCGPDSFLKAFIRPASEKPFLTLQFDGHSNDAGMMTRCEAYLDSKGILRWWRTCKQQPAPDLLPDERSTSPRWPIPVPD